MLIDLGSAILKRPKDRLEVTVHATANLLGDDRLPNHLTQRELLDHDVWLSNDHAFDLLFTVLADEGSSPTSNERSLRGVLSHALSDALVLLRSCHLELPRR